MWYLWIVSVEQVCVLGAVHHDVGTSFFPSWVSVPEGPLPAGAITAAVPHPELSDPRQTRPIVIK